MTDSFQQYGLKLAYEQLEKRGDKLQPFQQLIEWNKFRTIFFRRAATGRPPYDPVMMFKVLVLQHLYGISDEDLEYQVCYRLDFQRFLEFPKIIPDHSTIWRFREYLSEQDLHDLLWNELDRQINQKGITYSKGVIQDAKFITANPGKTNSGMSDRGRGQPTTRNEDASWTKKNNKSVFGYKLHTKMEKTQHFVTELAVTTASVHDSVIDLTIPEEVVFRDKGYFGVKPRAKGDGTMQRAVRGKKLSIREHLRNKRISKRRSPGERPYAVIQNVLHGAHTRYTELHRVFTQQLMNVFVYNLLQLKRVC